MKGKSAPLVAVAITMMISAIPCSAAPSGTPQPLNGVGKVQASWPRWYYYDQIGLREWHKGDRDRALNYFDQSYKMAEAALTGRRALDNRTKQMITDVVNHQQFHMTVWRSPAPEASRTASLRELATRGITISPSERDRQLRWLERLTAFAKRALGPKHLEVQALERHRHYLTPQPEFDAMINTQGKANHGTVIRPKWYTNNERDFTPEMFTRNPRKLHEEGTEDQKRMDVTKLPEEKIQKGYSYSGGKKIDLSKVQATTQGKGWGGSVTQGGTIDQNNPHQRPSGWGTGGEATQYGDSKTTEQTKWGMGTQEQSSGGRAVKRTGWGQGGEEKDEVFNKPWGSGNQSNQDEQTKTNNQQ